MNFPESYFEDQIREGFYVPGMIKRAWAAELEVLSQVDRVCRDHQISYFADWGSLLAATRHRGFIPWDDDLDIVMKRRDYQRFLQVAGDLPEGYHIINHNTHDDFWLFLARVTGRDHICFDPDHLDRFHQFPYMCGVDIFILDSRYDDQELEGKRCQNVLYTIAMADTLGREDFSPQAKQAALGELKSRTGIEVDSGLSGLALKKYLYNEAEKLMACVDEEDSHTLSQLFPFGLKNPDFGFPKSFYGNAVRLPFETTTIPVPLNYTVALSKRYQNYMHVVKNWGGHDYPYFKKQQEDLEALADFPIPHFIYSRDLLRQNQTPASVERETYKSVISQYRSALTQAGDTLIKHMASADSESVQADCADLQGLCQDLGNLLDAYLGQNSPAVGLLEEVCETFYRIYTNAHQETFDSLNLEECLSRIDRELETILSQRLVVFLPFKAEYWARMQAAYEEEKNRPGTRLLVVPLAYAYKRCDGSLHDTHYDPEDYPKELKVLGNPDFNLAAYAPDVIYFQYPYDQWNETTQISREYFSDRLQESCSQLIYIPWFVTEDFTVHDETPYSITDYYVTKPGVIRADQVWVDSPNLRQVYIDRLCAFAGPETRPIWEEKIMVREFPSAETSRHEEAQSTKHILYYLSLSELTAGGDKSLEKLEHNLDLFCQYQGQISLVWYPDPLIEEMLGHLNPALYENYHEILKKHLPKEALICGVDLDSDHALTLCDAYYGDADAPGHRFHLAGKPVMIANRDLI